MGGSGLFTVGANWSNGVPTSTDNACITAAGTYTVTLQGDADVK